MDTTFITIHDLSPEAIILYSSDSIVDILGYSPEDVVGQSCWDFFDPQELPMAQLRHGRSVDLDKAAVLAYCRMIHQQGYWVRCEVVFTVVYDVLVGCTSIYQRSVNSESRAANAPVIRRLFSNSPSDPRYHMLSHLSPKFTSTLQYEGHEPRAALFLNRYTRTLTIMYATDGLADILGIRSESLIGSSFYFCIHEDCLQDAVRCLESAKSNDSIAYLRFWYRDPTQDTLLGQASAGSDGPRAETHDDGRPDVVDQVSTALTDETSLRNQPPPPPPEPLPPPIVEAQQESSSTFVDNDAPTPTGTPALASSAAPGQQIHQSPQRDSGTSSADSNTATYEAVLGDPGLPQDSSASSASNTPQQRQEPSLRPELELEAVISCTSDGLVVCMRRAKPMMSHVPEPRPAAASNNNGLFAAPWATKPMYPPPSSYQYRPAAAPMTPQPVPQPAQHVTSTNESYMSAIREIGVFAWAVTGINGSLAEYGRGVPRGSAIPEHGLPIWESDPA